MQRYIKDFLKKITNQSPNAVRGLERHNIFRHCFEFSAKNSVNGDILEFGCYQGDSSKRIIRSAEKVKKFNSSWNPDFWIFDSFEGLPNLTSPYDTHPSFTPFSKGEYAANFDNVRQNILTTDINPNKLHMIPGFFEDSLQNLSHSPTMISAVHIDVDLYSSCKTVLEFLTDKLQDGTLLIFDDYYCYRGNPNYGVPKAINEWSDNRNIMLSEYCNYSWAGKVFIVHA